MEHLDRLMDIYRAEMKNGVIPTAYKELMAYIMQLRTHFQQKYPDHFVSGSIYQGYMDMTYFSFISPSLKRLKLKPAIVFIHETCRFEIWLAAANNQVQLKYWQLFRQSGWNKYRIVPSVKGVDAILKFILVNRPDSSDLQALSGQIEQSTLDFIKEIEQFLDA